MNPLYIITGAAGHLGSTLVRLLASRSLPVRGLLLPEEEGLPFSTVSYVYGDVRDPASLLPLFANAEGRDCILVHCAGVVCIEDRVTPALEAVNVQGTQHIIDLCARFAVRKLVYVSSVHAIPEGDPLRVIVETSAFSADAVHGAYAKTKAEATRRVLEAGQNGLNVTVVHPSGILGPYDNTGNHLVQMVADYVKGRLPAGIQGGYDFVDVRDVAEGCLAAANDPASGECYILCGRYYSVRELFAIIRAIRGGRRVPILPIWLARAVMPLMAGFARLRGRRPLYTAYSLYTLRSNARFSCEKAVTRLGFHPRDLFDTLQDTIRWMEAEPVPKGVRAITPSV